LSVYSFTDFFVIVNTYLYKSSPKGDITYRLYHLHVTLYVLYLYVKYIKYNYK
jgi:hypothetical protein